MNLSVVDACLDRKFAREKIDPLIPLQKEIFFAGSLYSCCSGFHCIQ